MPTKSQSYTCTVNKDSIGNVASISKHLEINIEYIYRNSMQNYSSVSPELGTNCLQRLSALAWIELNAPADVFSGARAIGKFRLNSRIKSRMYAKRITMYEKVAFYSLELG